MNTAPKHLEKLAFIALPLMSIMTLICPIQSDAVPQLPPNSQEQASDDIRPFLLCGFGDINLSYQNFYGALDFYKKALEEVNFDDDFDNKMMEFMILFRMTVAYDNLNMIDQCKNNITQMKELIASIPDDTETEDEDEEASEVMQFLTSIANLSPTDEIRNELVAMLQ